MPKASISSTQEIEYLVDDFTDPWKKPETLVLQHGFQRHPGFLYAWVPTLARHFRVIRPYLRGTGGSSRPTGGSPWTLEGLASDLMNLLAKLGVDNAHYVGEASAGLIGFSLAINHPEVLRTLTVLGTTATYKAHGNVFKKYNYPKWIQEGKREELMRLKMPERFGNNPDPDMLEWHIKEGLRWSPEVELSILNAWSQVDLKPELSKIKTPTLLITGELYTLGATVEQMKELRTFIPGSKLVVLPGVVNPTFLAPEKSAETVLGFIREVARG